LAKPLPDCGSDICQGLRRPLFLLFPCAFFGLWILLQNDRSLNLFRGWFLFIGGAGFAAFILMALLKPSWRQMVIHEDHTQTPFRKIFF
jgi:hypothetical protein